MHFKCRYFDFFK